jgi:hypothetical protein
VQDQYPQTVCVPHPSATSAPVLDVPQSRQREQPSAEGSWVRSAKIPVKVVVEQRYHQTVLFLSCSNDRICLDVLQSG